jgi:type IV pilus assembly protein PilF
MKLRVVVWLAVCALLLAGCAGSPRSVDNLAAADRPVLEMPPANEAEQAALVHVELGTAYFEVARYDVALDEARIALAYAPNYAPAFHLMGLVYMFLDDDVAARENFLRALRIAPNDPDFNNSYGWFLCMNDQQEEGLRRLALAARNPYYRSPARPHTNAGLCHLEMDQYDQAGQQFRRALALQPGNPVAMLGMAEVSYRKGDLAGAREQLIALHRQAEPTAESVWLGLRVERKLGNRTAELSYAAQLRGRFEDSPEYRALMQGNYE